MSGPAPAQELSSRVPGLRVLFLSGHPRESSALPGLPDGPRVLAKPFTAPALLERVRQVLDGE